MDKCTHCGGEIFQGVCDDCGRPAVAQELVTAGAGGMDSSELAAAAGAAGALDSTTSTGRTRGTAKFNVNYPTRAGASKTTAGATTRRRAGVTTHSTTRRTALGGGLISLPEQPSQDPLKLLMENPEIPAHKRHCPKCDAKVKLVKGFCGSCGTPYDFQPKLKPGDMVAGKYEVKGAMAFGGLGWIYLAFDVVLQRWVVMKGLLNAADEASAAAAVAERRYLAAVKHPKIVGIYDFVQHGQEGLIIMEFVSGATVHSLRKARGPLPVEEAIAYILGILPAFTYLHGQGLVYCDFKPDNLMIEGGDVKLIDMGAVRRIGDPNGDLYATIGFAAPEADVDPIAVSDLYTIGRTLAVLIMDFQHTGKFERNLPSPDEQAVLADNESLYRFLLRATHPDPDERFQTAEEMADQLFGVLREIVALKTGPKPVDSKVFTGDRVGHMSIKELLSAPNPVWLPALRVDLQDRAANEVIRVLSLMDQNEQLDELAQLLRRFGDKSQELRLRRAEILIQNPALAPTTRNEEISNLLSEVERVDAFDWRASWYLGVHLLMQGKAKEAATCFEKVYFEMPGELAPRLGMGFAAEVAGDEAQALSYYDRVGSVDPSFISAHLGSARCHAKTKQLADALKSLEHVPSNHAFAKTARLCSVRLCRDLVTELDGQALVKLEAATEEVTDMGIEASQTVAKMFSALANLCTKLSWNKGTFAGLDFAPAGLALGAEAKFRQAARQSETASEREQWIMAANAARPVTLI